MTNADLTLACCVVVAFCGIMAILVGVYAIRPQEKDGPGFLSFKPKSKLPPEPAGDSGAADYYVNGIWCPRCERAVPFDAVLGHLDREHPIQQGTCKATTGGSIIRVHDEVPAKKRTIALCPSCNHRNRQIKCKAAIKTARGKVMKCNCTNAFHSVKKAQSKRA